MLSYLRFGVLSVLSSLTVMSVHALTVSELPPMADTGQCFARVLMPEVTETLTEQILVEAEKITSRRIPAVYAPETVRVQIKEATTGYRAVPAVYETITEQIMIVPERSEQVVVPATYETWTETIEIEPARLVWKTGSGLYGRGMVEGGAAAIEANVSAPAEISTGEVLCRVMQPAKTRTVTRTRMVTPARTETRVIPAEYETVTRQVVREDARVETYTIDAEYADITVDVMVEPERIVEDVTPAVYRTVERRQIVSNGGLSWAEVLCDTNTTRDKVAEIQAALVDQGYVLQVDGIYGGQTQAAMEQFQRANGLAVGYMTVTTVEALNVSPYS